MSPRAWSLVLLVTGLAGCDLVPLGGSDETAPEAAPAPTAAAEPAVASPAEAPAPAPEAKADPKPTPQPKPEPAVAPAAPATAEPAALPPEPTLAPPTPAAPPNEDDEGVDCPPGADDEHPCRAPLPRGDFSFGEPLAFTTPLTVDLEPPTTMPADRWQVVRSADLPDALDKQLKLERMRLQGMAELHDDPLWAIDEAFDGTSLESPAGWWWPAPGEPVLAIPCAHRVAVAKDDKRVVHTLVLARKDGTGWKAAVVPTTLPSQLDAMRERPALVPDLQTRVALRYDHLEWLSLSQIFSEGRQAVADEEKRWACRVAWHDGALRQACTDAWGATGP